MKMPAGSSICLICVLVLASCSTHKKVKVSCNDVFPLQDFNRYAKPVLERELNTAPVRDYLWFRQTFSAQEGASSELAVTDSTFTLVNGQWKWASPVTPPNNCVFSNVFSFPGTTITVRRLIGKNGCHSPDWVGKIIGKGNNWAWREYGDAQRLSPYSTQGTYATYFQAWSSIEDNLRNSGAYTSKTTIRRFGGIFVEYQSGCTEDHVDACQVKSRHYFSGVIRFGGHQYVFHQEDAVNTIDRGDIYCEEKDPQSCGVLRMMSVFPWTFYIGPPVEIGNKACYSN